MQDNLKMRLFRDDLLSEARAEANKILSRLRDARREAIRDAEAGIRNDAARYENTKKAEITSRESRRVSAHRNENHHTLLKYREECAREVFDMVVQLIQELTASEKYPQHLAALLSQAADLLGSGCSAELILRPEDMHLSDFLISTVPSIELQVSEGDFSLGGFQIICPSRSLCVDSSFDSALDDLGGRFSELSGMRLMDDA